MMPWNQNQLNNLSITEGVNKFATTWIRAGEMQLTLSASFNEDGPAYDDIVRIVCHHAIENIPNDGLTELCETLGEMIEFYGEREIHNPTASLPLIDTVTATEGNEYNRQPFHISDE